MKNLNHDERYVSYENVIYRLSGHEMIDYKDASYPRFRTMKTEESYYTSFEEAENRIIDLVNKEENSHSHWHSFMIDQVPVGINCPPEFYQIRRTYSYDGSFVMQSYASTVDDVNGYTENFLGRDEEDITFNSGDIVEVFNGSVVTLEIIVRVPGSKENVKEWLKEGAHRFRDGYTTLSRSDDNYDMDQEATDCYPANTLNLEECYKQELYEIYENFVKTYLNKEK